MGVSRSTIAAVRFGYGLKPGERPPRDGDDLMSQIALGAADATGFPTVSLAERRRAQKALVMSGRLLSEVEADATPDELASLQAARDKARDRLHAGFNQDAHRRVAQAVRSPHGFYERLASFWTNHFAIAARKNTLRATVADHEAHAIRPAIGGAFDTLLQAAIVHPAMLIYLDQARSVGPNSKIGRKKGEGLNENLAREILELHTLGVDGGYTQADVSEFARLLTGLRVGKNFAARFNENAAEPGVKTVLGRRYGSAGAPHTLNDVRRALADLSAEPATRRHVSAKLARHFIADDPPADAVGAMESAWAASNGALGPVYRALVEHPSTWDRFGEKVKSPFDFLVSALRAAAVPEEALAAPPGLKRNPATLDSLRLLGQPIWRPLGPDGWPDDAASWITAEGLARRLDWSARAGRRISESRRLTRPETQDPRTFLDAALADAVRPTTRFLVNGAAERWEGFALVFASPEFNRR